MRSRRYEEQEDKLGVDPPEVERLLQDLCQGGETIAGPQMRWCVPERRVRANTLCNASVEFAIENGVSPKECILSGHVQGKC
jgi:hypothetical protein